MSEIRVGGIWASRKNGYEVVPFEGRTQLFITDWKWNNENGGLFQGQKGYPLASFNSESDLDVGTAANDYTVRPGAH
jgi:hypothetical protein